MPALDPEKFANAAWQMASQPDVALTVESIMLSARDLTRAVEVGVMRAQSDDQVEIVGTSSAAVQQADELQLAYGEGPCLSATRTAETCLIVDTRADRRWPTWGPRAAELGWSSVLSLPLLAADRSLGALNLYATAAHSFQEVDIQVAQIFAAHASIALAYRLDEEQLRARVHLRHVVGQAQGILMERHHVPAEQALAALQRQADEQQRELYSVAQEIIGVRSAQQPGPLR